jgi:hypothetical protein
MRCQNAVSTSPSAARTNWSAIGRSDRHHFSSPKAATVSIRVRIFRQSSAVPVSVMDGMPHTKRIQNAKYGE